MRRSLIVALCAGLVAFLAAFHLPYPIDGYDLTGIRRLLYLERVQNGELEGDLPPEGARKSLMDIQLHLPGADSLDTVPAPDPALQRRLERLFADRDDSYGITVFDITPGAPARYAELRPTNRYQPGSVGKLAIATGFFAELRRRYPDRPERRRALLKEHTVQAGQWIVSDHHTIPLFDPETNEYTRRQPRPSDVFSLYEWVDFMLSPSSNAAASVVWKEATLMRAFGDEYPASEEREQQFLESTPADSLGRIAHRVVHKPLDAAGIPERMWRLGSFFTHTASRRIDVPGGSIGTPQGLMRWMLRLEQGRIVDPWSSLELKRLLYMTGNRIRYASAPTLRDDAVYFKSGSLYSCEEEEGFTCEPYTGNRFNYMNSIAIVETADGRVYMVAMMSNVLRVNSAVEHQSLATFIERIVADLHEG
ncbi:hypothetical protein [Salinibacter altiplanensis]|uniref:hypothetical protein n=1 Tax=Salinibacter altiplanensis TaxID=1803181 RepID=UPI000C9ED75D|nr:hypothetical protein [Salinibacter altiplanensis]